MDWHNVQGLPALTWLFLWQTCYPKKTSGFRKWIYYLNLKNDHHVFTKIRWDSINWKRLTKKNCGWKRKSESLKWSFSILLLVKNVYCREKANDVTTVLAWCEESKPKSRTHCTDHIWYNMAMTRVFPSDITVWSVSQFHDWVETSSSLLLPYLLSNIFKSTTSSLWNQPEKMVFLKFRQLCT